jgi:hypothetical protein
MIFSFAGLVQAQNSGSAEQRSDCEGNYNDSDNSGSAFVEGAASLVLYYALAGADHLSRQRGTADLIRGSIKKSKICFIKDGNVAVKPARVLGAAVYKILFQHRLIRSLNR